MGSVTPINAGSASDYLRMRDGFICDLDHHVQELSECFQNKKPLNKASLGKIQKTCNDFQTNVLALSRANKESEKKWILTKCGRRCGIALKATLVILIFTVPILNGFVTYYQAIPPSLPTPMPTPSIAQNSTETVMAPSSVATPTNTYYSNLLIALTVPLVVSGIAQGLQLIFAEKYQEAVDEYESEREKLLNETLLEKQVQSFITALEEFEAKKDRQNFHTCLETLKNAASSKLIESFGSVDKIISNLLYQTDDPEIKGQLELLQKKIKDDITDKEKNKRRIKRRMHHEPGHSSSRRGNLASERGLDERFAHRNSLTVVTGETLDNIRQFITDLNLPLKPINLQIGEWWISDEGVVSRTENELLSISNHPAAVLDDSAPRWEIVIS